MVLIGNDCVLFFSRTRPQLACFYCHKRAILEQKAMAEPWHIFSLCLMDMLANEKSIKWNLPMSCTRSWWWIVRGGIQGPKQPVCSKRFWKSVKAWDCLNDREGGEWRQRCSAHLLKARMAYLGVLAQIKILFDLCDYAFQWRTLRTWEQRILPWFPHKYLWRKIKQQELTWVS